jgi:hypothetical protein
VTTLVWENKIKRLNTDGNEFNYLLPAALPSFIYANAKEKVTRGILAYMIKLQSNSSTVADQLHVFGLVAKYLVESSKDIQNGDLKVKSCRNKIKKCFDRKWSRKFRVLPTRN